MLTKRIIPCLDVRDGKVVKGVQFQDLQELASPIDLAKRYNAAGADELVFYDITASAEGRALFSDILQDVAREIFIPLTVGGGINTLADFERVLNSGADKVSINSGALKDPSLIERAAKKYGSQCVVLSVDIKKAAGTWHVFSQGGRIDTRKDALAWIREGQERGAGEIVANSMDTDGVRAGFDLPLLRAITETTELPVIASGGAGNAQDFVKLFQSVPKIDAGLAASIFHHEEVSIKELKEQLKAAGIPVRTVK